MESDFSFGYAEDGWGEITCGLCGNSMWFRPTVTAEADLKDSHRHSSPSSPWALGSTDHELFLKAVTRAVRAESGARSDVGERSALAVLLTAITEQLACASSMARRVSRR